MKSVPTIDMTGQRFGRLVAVRYSDKKDGRMAWVCQCDCGNTKEIRGSMLRQGKTRSCGCYRDEVMSAGMRKTHGMYFTRTHKSWDAMIQRCTNPKNKSYGRYGGSGVLVCERWLTSFESFLADMGERPHGKSLDRYPRKDGHYEPGNCRWATHKQQSNNLSNNFIVSYRGAQYTIRELSDFTGVDYSLLRCRIYRDGWDAERAISTPLPVVVTEDLANEIRRCLAAGEEQRPIAAKFGVSQALVSKISRGVWKPSIRGAEYERTLRKQDSAIAEEHA